MPDLQEQKSLLTQKSGELRDSLRQQLDHASELVETRGKQFLIIAGVVVVVYGLVVLLSSGGEEEEADQGKVVVVNAPESGIVAAIKRHIAEFLLALAKQKLTAYLEEMRNKNTRKA